MALTDAARRARPALDRIVLAKQNGLTSQAKLLETLSYQATLNRGYAIVRDGKGKVLRSAEHVVAAEAVAVTLADGTVDLAPTSPARPPKKTVSKTPPKSDPGDQGSLF